MSPAIEIKNSRFICETNHCTKTDIAKTTNAYLEGWGGLAWRTSGRCSPS